MTEVAEAPTVASLELQVAELKEQVAALTAKLTHAFGGADDEALQLWRWFTFSASEVSARKERRLEHEEAFSPENLRREQECHLACQRYAAKQNAASR